MSNKLKSFTGRGLVLLVGLIVLFRNPGAIPITLASLARDPNIASNVLGALLVVLASSQLDWAKIVARDRVEGNKLVAILLMGAISYYVGKGKPPEPKPA